MKKKIIICLLALVISLVATIELSISNLAQNTVVYNVELSDNSKINEILIDENGTDIEYENIEFLEISTSVIDDIKIEYDGQIIVTDKDKNVVIDETGPDDDIYVHTVSKINVISDAFSKKSILFFGLSFAISLLSLIFIVKFTEKYKDSKDSFKIVDFVILSLCILSIYFMVYYFLLYILDVAVLVLPLLLVFYLIYSMKDNLKEKKENLYVIFVIVFGITMIFSLPPFNAPDEFEHFLKSYTSSTINDDQGVTKLPATFESFHYKYAHALMDYKIDFNAKSYLDDLLQTPNNSVLGEDEFIYRNTKYMKVLPYLPSIIGIYFLKLFNASALVICVMGRFFSLLVMMIMYYLAIKNVPILKRVFFVICLFPIVLHQAVINQDYLTNATTILLLALVLKYRFEETKMGIKEMAALSVLGLMLSSCKFGYFIFVFSILLIPCKLFKNKSIAVLFKILFIMIPILLSFTGNVSIVSAGDTRHYTIDYSINNPINTIKIFAKTFWQRGELDLIRGQFDGFGVSTKWNNGLVSSILLFIYTLFFFSSEKSDVKRFDKITRITLLIIGVLLVGIIYAAMYLNWTYLGASTIDGLQPRYFTPAVLLLSLAFANSLFEINIKNKEKMDAILICIIYVCSLSTIILGFYA